MTYYSLLITKQPPSHAFPSDWFEIEFAVEQEHNAPISLDHLILHAKVHLHKGITSVQPSSEECSPDVAKLVVDPATPFKIILQQSLSKITSLVKCKLEATVPADIGVTICIIFSLESENNYFSHAVTEPIRLVNYKLWIEPKNWEEVWYKDEGGRDKCMIAQVELHRLGGSLATGRRVPLKLKLTCVDATRSSTLVQNQDILYIFGSPNQDIDPETGKAMIRFRIQEVSKNHQSQDFVLQICADSTQSTDVACASTPPVSVRSKKSNYKRIKFLQQSGTNISLPPPPPRQGIEGAPFVPPPQQGMEDRVLSQRRGISLPPPTPQKDMEEISILPPPQLGIEDNPITPWNPRSASSTTSALIQRLPTITPQLLSTEALKTPFPMSSHTHLQSSTSSSQAFSSLPQSEGAVTSNIQKATQLSDATHDITTWAEEVVSGLFPLQWKVVGYATFSNGTTDYNRPFHSMPNPNEYISHVLSRYSSSVKVNLQILTATLEEATVRIERKEKDKDSLAYGSESSTRSMPQQPHLSATASDRSSSAYDFNPQKERGASSNIISREEIESQVAYVMAIPYTTLRTKQTCGFPTFNKEKEIIGFFQVAPHNSFNPEQFVPIDWLSSSTQGAETFDTLEKEHATSILNVALDFENDALLPVKKCDSVFNLLESAMLREWSKTCSNKTPSSRPSSSFKFF